ncbi:hypothetical protein TanjilG_22210 [Lupinus angustifolius]|uniref:Pectinesterase n=2 Tax=Lupinus angustifolius TaxID=3871 RepID=A0A4P1QU95_LUPAN|nr:hypothetical protein TanjilG_22210 [Lupinus angustifolius]
MPSKPLSKILWLILSIAIVLSSLLLISSYLIKPIPLFNPSSSLNICEYAIDTKSCLAHVSEVTQVPNLATTTQSYKLKLLQSILKRTTSYILKGMDTANAIKLKGSNSPKDEAALHDCEELMDLSNSRVKDSMVALSKRTIDSMQDAHSWLSSVLTNHATCLDGLEGSARTLMEAEVKDLISRSRTSLALLVAILPPKPKGKGMIDEVVNGRFPSWVRRKDRRVLECSVGEIEANVVVAKDGSGEYETVAEAVASVPDKSKTRYVIYVKNGTYNENVEISSKKKNVMLIGDGMNATIITGSLNNVDGTTTFRSATLAAVGDGFIAQDIWFQNTAGPEKHQAVALRVGADQSIINRCRIDAYQDTLYAHSNRQFYRDSFITGTVDFIFGNAGVVFQNCNLQARKPMDNQNNMVTAQGRIDPNQNTGTSIQQCQLTPSPDLEPVVGSIKSYLGRPWKNFSRTVVMQSSIDNHIDPAGWAEWDAQHKDYLETLYYGEYMNNGPGAGLGRRVNWSGFHILGAEDANNFTVKELIQGDVWLKNTGVTFIEGL